MYKWPNRCSQLRYRASAIPTTGTLAPVQDYSVDQGDHRSNLHIVVIQQVWEGPGELGESVIFYLNHRHSCPPSPPPPMGVQGETTGQSERKTLDQMMQPPSLPSAAKGRVRDVTGGSLHVGSNEAEIFCVFLN
jgi:hypothetical protein